MEAYLDKWGHINPNSWCEQSENPLLFTIQYHYLLRDTFDLENNYWQPSVIFNLLMNNIKSNNGSFRTLPSDSNPRFSLDNMCAVAGFSYRYKFKKLLKALPLFRRYSYRPDNFIYLLFCKYPLIGFWFLWITSIFMIISCLRAAPSKTSGPLLCYVKARGANMRFTWFICEKVLAMRILDCFHTYYPEHDHPINIEARKVFGH